MTRDELINKIHNYMVGTCESESSIEEHWEADLLEHNLTALDAFIEAEIDYCAACGWVFDNYELEEVSCELVCSSCKEEDNA